MWKTQVVCRVPFVGWGGPGRGEAEKSSPLAMDMGVLGSTWKVRPQLGLMYLLLTELSSCLAAPSQLPWPELLQLPSWLWPQPPTCRAQ